LKKAFICLNLQQGMRRIYSRLCSHNFNLCLLISSMLHTFCLRFAVQVKRTNFVFTIWAGCETKYYETTLKLRRKSAMHQSEIWKAARSTKLSSTGVSALRLHGVFAVVCACYTWILSLMPV